MGFATEIEKAIVSLQSPFNTKIAGYRRIEASRDQGQHRILAAQWKPTQTLVLLADDEELVLANFEGPSRQKNVEYSCVFWFKQLANVEPRPVRER